MYPLLKALVVFIQIIVRYDSKTTRSFNDARSLIKTNARKNQLSKSVEKNFCFKDIYSLYTSKIIRIYNSTIYLILHEFSLINRISRSCTILLDTRYLYKSLTKHVIIRTSWTNIENYGRLKGARPSSRRPGIKRP